jgi:hypothetical protein
MKASAALALLLAGCVHVGQTEASSAPFAIPPAAAAQRVMQSRRYETRDEIQVLRASGALLIDLGFTIDKSEETLGVLVASKNRTAVETGQVFFAVFLSALAGADVPYDDHQKFRASVVVRPSGQKSLVVRVTFQRIVWDTHGNVSKREAMNKPEYYQEFFEKLSKALFLEAHEA